MNALVLGGTGFIGSHLVDRLVSSDHRVRVIGRRPNVFRSPGAEYRFFELGDREQLDASLEGIDVVFHLVSTTIPKTSNQDPQYDIQTNLVDTVFLLECCVARGIQKLVYVSTGGAVYGRPTMLPVPESHGTAPDCFYGATKLAVENYVALFHRLHGLDYAIIRPSNPYGERQNPLGQQGVIGVLCWKLLTGQEMVIWGDGGVVRDYIYVKDVVDALFSAGTRPTPERIYNIGSGSGKSLNELVSLIELVGKRSMRVRYEPGRAFDVPSIYLDSTRAMSSLGWQPMIGLEEGVEKTLTHLSRERMDTESSTARN